MKRENLLPGRWPITVKIPLVVALFMASISAIITNTVLDRLAATQERHFETLAAVYLDALSSAVLPYVLRDDTWEVFDALDRASTVGSFGKVEVIVAAKDGSILASTNPRDSKPASLIPEALRSDFDRGADVAVQPARGRAEARRKLLYQGRDLGTIYATFDIATLLRERRDVLRTLVLANVMLAILLMATAYWAVRRMVAPVRVLSTHLDRSLLGPVQPINADYVGKLKGEYSRLFQSFNAMAAAVNEREALASQLAGEERLASLGRLASGMAHEINNPLGGLFNALDTLRRYGHDPSVRDRSLGLLERGLSHVRDVVRATLVTYKSEHSSRRLNSGDLDDLRLLLDPEVARKGLTLSWTNSVRGEVAVSAGAVRQATLNLLLNAIEATPPGGAVGFRAELDASALHIAVVDEGRGLDHTAQEYLRTQGAPPAPTGTGLGLWIVRRLISEARGRISVDSPPWGHGSRIQIVIPFQGSPSGSLDATTANECRSGEVVDAV